MENNQLPLANFEQARKLKAARFDWPTMYFAIEDDDAKTIFYAPTTTNPIFHIAEPRDWNNEGAPGASGKGRYISVPTIALTFQWARVKHNLSCEIWRTASGWMWAICKSNGISGGTGVSHLDNYDNRPGTNDGGAFDDFDACASDVLDELLTLIKK